MPLIIITGIPSSGKTRRANQLKKYYEKNDKNVVVVSESDACRKAGFEKNSLFLDSQKEKQVRGFLKSEVQRLINDHTVVILDAANYIKGYRYELYCLAKANKCTQCTVHCEIDAGRAFEFNEDRPDDEKYSRETFDALVMRYEPPDSRNRWDSPLFVPFVAEELEYGEVDRCLFDRKPQRPNMSTQNVPLSSTNFLYELDRITQDVDREILSAIRSNLSDGVVIPGTNVPLNCAGLTAPKLTRLRRQFIGYTKTHPTDLDRIPVLYVQFLKSQMNV